MKKIYLFAQPTGKSSYGYIQDAEITGDTMGYALCEDGTCLASHWSSGVNWSKHDMGLTSEWKHDIYTAHCPDGFELEWIDFGKLDTHKGYLKAYELHQRLNQSSEGHTDNS